MTDDIGDGRANPVNISVRLKMAHFMICMNFFKQFIN